MPDLDLTKLLTSLGGEFGSKIMDLFDDEAKRKQGAERVEFLQGKHDLKEAIAGGRARQRAVLKFRDEQEGDGE